jgi:hypothetical protein
MSKPDDTPAPRLIYLGDATESTNAFVDEPIPEEIVSTLGLPD